MKLEYHLKICVIRIIIYYQELKALKKEALLSTYLPKSGRYILKGVPLPFASRKDKN